MFEISQVMNWKIREKRAKRCLNLTDASKEIGISRQTLRHVENEQQKEVTKTVYEKLVNWLFSPDEMGG